MQPIGEIVKDINIKLIGADPATAGGFTQVPNFILTSKRIGVGAKLTYAMLLKYAWYDGFCFPGQETLAIDMGTSKRSVITYLKELEALGYIIIVRRGLGKSNLYELNMTIKTKQRAPSL